MGSTRESMPEKYDLEKVMEKNIKKMNSFVHELEFSLIESQENDRQLLMSLQMDDNKNKKLILQLEEARKENKELLNILQQKCSENCVSRSTSRSQIDLSSSYSTLSMVNLQYKYEELVANYEGLLKVLESRGREVHKCYSDNDSLRDDIKKLSLYSSERENILRKMCEKFVALKSNKELKIKKLRTERDTLQMVHEQMVKLLNKQCVEREQLLTDRLKEALNPKRSALLREVKRTNRLEYENALLRQEIAYLRSKLSYRHCVDQ